MSAIAGIIYKDTYEVSRLIKPMLDTLSHRGYPEKEIFPYKNIELGTCGNTISKGSKKRVSAGIDGTIVNAQELRNELSQMGFHSEKESNSELVMQAYAAWGMACLTRINGSFAFFIFDEEKEHLIIARDRIGNKPLYWFHDSHHFIFGSEIKGLLSTGVVPQEPSPESFAVYLTMGYFPQDFTPIQGVNKLLPGYYLKIQLSQKKVIQPFWSLSSCFMRQTYEPVEVIAEKLDDFLSLSVQRNLRLEESAGCFLSGGLGSSSTAYFLNKLKEDRKIEAFTTGFAEENRADIETAEKVSSALRMPHYCSLVMQDFFLHDLVRMLWHLDEPLADPNILLAWQLTKMATQQTRCVFSGMGCDELLASHLRYTAEERKGGYQLHLRQWMHPLLKKFIIPLFRHVSPTIAYRMLKESKVNPWQAEFIYSSMLFPEGRLAQVSPSLEGMFDIEVFFHKFHHINRLPSITSSFLYFDVKTCLPERYILQFERFCSVHGLTWQTPFLDREVVEFITSIPSPEILSGKDTAAALKIILDGHLPEEVVNRSKHTRLNFLKSWVEAPELLEAFHLLDEGTLVDNGLLSKRWLQEKLASPASRYASFPQLWAILVWEIWFRLFINRPVRSEVPDIRVKDLLRE